MAREHLEISLSGKVQGVSLRYTIKEEADKLGIKGYARNLRDGSVMVEAEGESEQLNEFVGWLKSSPGLSEVRESTVGRGEIKGYREFQTY